VSRLDETLVARNLAASRSRARDMVLRGSVTINGTVSTKPSKSIFETDKVEVTDVAQAYVSRAALKLICALEHFKLSPREKFCLDIGASTGGFTQVLLERGAKHVVALDVGHDQLVPMLAEDPRVTSIEGQNARDLSNLELEPPGFITADVSFISLQLALPPALKLSVPGAELVALIKPQFEVGKNRLPRDGVVKDTGLHQAICEDISRFLAGEGWHVMGNVASPIDGGDGNREFLIAAVKEKAPRP
jgi:23S rRNA (cytidine1920-2'-O)/16S rRNA (cytidine1409-2'-O)-methyltransferase